MAKENRLAGEISLQIGGNQYLAAGDFTYDPSSYTRETLSGPSKVAGYKETPNIGFIEGEIFLTKGLTIGAIRAMDDVDVFLSLANGTVVTGTSMWTVGESIGNSGEGKTSVRFEGAQVIEDLGA